MPASRARIPLHDEVDPTTIKGLLLDFRERHELTKSEMLRRLQRYLPSTTFTTYTAWERGTIPRLLYARLIVEALRKIEAGQRRRGMRGA